VFCEQATIALKRSYQILEQVASSSFHPAQPRAATLFVPIRQHVEASLDLHRAVLYIRAASASLFFVHESLNHFHLNTTQEGRYEVMNLTGAALAPYQNFPALPLTISETTRSA
jgi:hypothetical protein